MSAWTDEASKVRGHIIASRGSTKQGLGRVIGLRARGMGEHHLRLKGQVRGEEHIAGPATETLASTGGSSLLADAMLDRRY